MCNDNNCELLPIIKLIKKYLKNKSTYSEYEKNNLLETIETMIDNYEAIK